MMPGFIWFCEGLRCRSPAFAAPYNYNGAIPDTSWKGVTPDGDIHISQTFLSNCTSASHHLIMEEPTQSRRQSSCGT